MKKYLFLLLCSSHASAVYVNHQGLGDVLIIPYYTVNNFLNTLISVTNPTSESKAIKINIREGLNGYAVLSYNVYLGAYDTWAFALVPSTSTIDGFVGQNSASLHSMDNSCAPGLNKSGEEFKPDELVDGPQDLSRAREGFIEIIEMGELQGDFVDFLYQGSGFPGAPNNCEAFEVAWETGGAWHAESGGDVSQDVIPGSGGLMAEVDIISVAEGINYSIPVVALDGFFAADITAHVSPVDSMLSLDAAAPQAIILANNKPYELAFYSGLDAVTAVLMADKLIGTYALDAVVAGKSETVLVQPTRRFYFEPNQATSWHPYHANRFLANCPDSVYGGTEMRGTSYDRESYSRNYDPCGGINCPFPKEPICGSVFVQSMVLPMFPPWGAQSQPEITQSNNYGVLTTPFPVYSDPINYPITENGFIEIGFINDIPPGPSLTGIDNNTKRSVSLWGLPVIGITLQQYTNATAAEGLLAKYGGSHQLRSKIRLVED